MFRGRPDSRLPGTTLATNVLFKAALMSMVPNKIEVEESACPPEVLAES
jgi:hypothetical protein